MCFTSCPGNYEVRPGRAPPDCPGVRSADGWPAGRQRDTLLNSRPLPTPKPCADTAVKRMASSWGRSHQRALGSVGLQGIEVTSSPCGRTAAAHLESRGHDLLRAQRTCGGQEPSPTQPHVDRGSMKRRPLRYMSSSISMTVMGDCLFSVID